MYKAYLGIDPGKKGALALLAREDARLLAARPMPDNVWDLYQLLVNWQNRFGPIFAVVEQAGAWRVDGKPQSGKSMFTYGRGFGGLEAALIIAKIPHQMIMPAPWTLVMHKGTYASEPKAKSLEAARRIWPGMQFKFSLADKRAHDGLVDAMLMAEYARRELFTGLIHAESDSDKGVQDNETKTSDHVGLRAGR